MKLYSPLLSTRNALEEKATPLIEMNTTPLIDVLLVLIVMLIITIPVPLQSINVDMPSSQQTSAVPAVVVLQIDAQGFVVWGGDKLANMADVNARIAAAATLAVQPEIHLQPSPDTPYAFVTAVLVLAKKAGLQKVGVVN